MLTLFYGVMGNPPETTGALNGMAAALFEESATVEQIAVALKACRRVPYPVRLPHILERLPGHGTADGRPEPETAWSMCPKSDDSSVVWTEEMAVAFEGARRLLMDGDAIAARMAFREAYAAELAKARTENRPIRWIVSMGWDKADRVRALSEAVEKKRISADHALELCGEQADTLALQLPAADRERLQLTGEVKKEVRLDLPGMPGVLKMLADNKALPGIDTEKGKVIPKRSIEEQLADLKRMETDGKISKESAVQLAQALQNKYGKEQRA